MNLCSDNHTEICFEGRNCPLCTALENHEVDVTSLDNRLYEAKQTIEALEQTIEELEELKTQTP